ncbi:hypothetical protein TNCV_735351 [Trichonephila clavipes]|uniref:PiggyBac transposable element-derived protein 4 C-terminal zinc-ribbon domain-containing protein n=1 Tax=Trichonephila clavipes TaxID=2585209 RepID=A0A8X6SY69_TRICX|nr:hypothetical protein TNCV_735351 [Trichonephila clavipes]
MLWLVCHEFEPSSTEDLPCREFHTVASEQKKQKFRPANIPYSISSSANRRIFLKKKERRSASFQGKKCVVLDNVRLANVWDHVPKMVSSYKQCGKCSRMGQEKRTRYMCAECVVPLGIATCSSF